MDKTQFDFAQPLEWIREVVVEILADFQLDAGAGIGGKDNGITLATILGHRYGQDSQQVENKAKSAHKGSAHEGICSGQ